MTRTAVTSRSFPEPISTGFRSSGAPSDRTMTTTCARAGCRERSMRSPENRWKSFGFRFHPAAWSPSSTTCRITSASENWRRRIAAPLRPGGRVEFPHTGRRGMPHRSLKRRVECSQETTRSTLFNERGVQPTNYGLVRVMSRPRRGLPGSSIVHLPRKTAAIGSRLMFQGSINSML